jgi:hypothetical protein
VLRNLSNKIDSFTWIPFVGDKNFGKSPVTSTMITDLTQLIQYPVGFYAVQPNVFEVSKPDFLSVYSQESGLPLGEQLYTAKGS